GTDAILDSNPANPRGALKNLYAMRGVSQWIWFLVRDELHQAADATLLDPRVWRDLTGQAKWAVHLWGEIAPEPHRHWRHPQTLLLSMDGFEMELIGVHLKSKINRESTFDADDQLKEGYVAKAYRARAFLATEANDIRRYIEGRFGQEPNPRIVVCGDMNDGPGKDYFERVFLYFDLISNMQGDVFFASDVDAFQSEKTKSDPIRSEQYAIARGLLRDFRDQRLPVDQVFDLDRTATYFALIDLCAAGHACRWKNIRFYYNPITSLLEPIPYNAYSARSAAGARVGQTPWLSGQFIYSEFHVTQWMDAFFKDPTFYEAYVRALNRVSQPTYLEEVFADIGPALEKKLRIIHKDYPAFRFSKDYLVNNSNLIRHAVRPVLPLRVRWNPDERQSPVPRISVANTLRLAVELLDITDTRTNRRFEFHPGAVIAPKTGDPPQDVSITLPGLASEVFRDFADDRFTLHYRVVGMTDRHSASVQSYGGESTKNLPQRVRESQDAFRKMEMFRIDDEQGTIRIEPGTWQVDRTVYVPRGFRLSAGPGVRIHLSHGASIISYSPVSLLGDTDHPIVVRGVGETGGGFVVLQADGQSTLRHVHFENLGQPREGSWRITGGVTFYESPLDIHHCRFSGGHAEDQLNIIRSPFTVADCRFEGAFGDAVDIDFSRGELRDCQFTRSNNDAIDLSGSEVVIERCSIIGTGDKAISAGESSRIEVADLVIADSRFGLVSKDLSSLVAHRVTFRTTDTALAAYQKKPEYGPATITADSVTTDTAEPTLLIQKGSWIEIEKGRLHGQKLDVARSLDGS
ncbi:MAG: right-handed parallel beta-helix repeat-containing protein, partial [Planctomycetes bacterium]|nr:right-handed parallel beta-helix repeat-containing protein [Planctomycetota bacterium]